MANFFAAREHGWTESSDSEEIESNYRSSDDADVPFAWHGPIIEVNPLMFSPKGIYGVAVRLGSFWTKKFFVQYLQHIINAA